MKEHSRKNVQIHQIWKYMLPLIYSRGFTECHILIAVQLHISMDIDIVSSLLVILNHVLATYSACPYSTTIRISRIFPPF